MSKEDLTTERAAAALGLSESWIRRLCLRGTIGHKPGRDWLISPAEVEHYRAHKRPVGCPPKNGK